MAIYSGTAPTKAYDAAYHYAFKGWDQDLSAVMQDMTVKPVFTAISHTFSYTKLDASAHKAVCACGFSKTENHSFVNGVCPCGEAEIKEPILIAA
jgi:hypothetical protein